MYTSKIEFHDSRGRPYYQATYNGLPLVGYYFVFHEGELLLISRRRGEYNQRLLKSRVSGKSKYPKVNVVVNEQGKSKTIHLHQIVAQTFIDYPLPDGVTESEWKRTPKSVKAHFTNHYWEANHIDHNHMNYHPDNLEWVSRGVNVDKYHEYRTS